MYLLSLLSLVSSLDDHKVIGDNKVIGEEKHPVEMNTQAKQQRARSRNRSKNFYTPTKLEPDIDYTKTRRRRRHLRVVRANIAHQQNLEQERKLCLAFIKDADIHRYNFLSIAPDLDRVRHTLDIQLEKLVDKANEASDHATNTFKLVDTLRQSNKLTGKQKKLAYRMYGKVVLHYNNFIRTYDHLEKLETIITQTRTNLIILQEMRQNIIKGVEKIQENFPHYYEETKRRNYIDDRLEELYRTYGNDEKSWDTDKLNESKELRKERKEKGKRGSYSDIHYDLYSKLCTDFDNYYSLCAIDLLSRDPEYLQGLTWSVGYVSGIRYYLDTHEKTQYFPNRPTYYGNKPQIVTFSISSPATQQIFDDFNRRRDEDWQKIKLFNCILK